MQLQLLAYTLGVVLWAALPVAMASAADLLKAGDAAYSSGNYNRWVVLCMGDGGGSLTDHTHVPSATLTTQLT